MESGLKPPIIQFYYFTEAEIYNKKLFVSCLKKLKTEISDICRNQKGDIVKVVSGRYFSIL